MTEKPKLAGKISVTRRGGVAHILIDGEAFPWWIERSSITVNVNPNEVPSVTITIVAEQVTVTDSLSSEVES